LPLLPLLFELPLPLLLWSEETQSVVVMQGKGRE
jgi:hypothetical protein